MEILVYRGLVALVFMGAVLRLRAISWRTPVPMMHVGRSAAGVFAMAAWFYALAHLPLATAMTLNYTSSVWVAAYNAAFEYLHGRPGEVVRQLKADAAERLRRAGCSDCREPSHD